MRKSVDWLCQRRTRGLGQSPQGDRSSARETSRTGPHINEKVRRLALPAKDAGFGAIGGERNEPNGAPCIMVERIEKKEHFEYWQVEASTQTHKDRKEGEESPHDQFSQAQETTDWNLFLDKSRLWNKNIQVLHDEIHKIIFQKINLKTDPSLLRIDVHLVGGEIISPAFISIVRRECLKLKNFTAGQEIPVSLLVRNKTLQIITPTNPQQFLEEEKKLQQKPKAPFIALSEDTTTVIKPAFKSPATFTIWDKEKHKIKFDVLALYIVTLILTFMFIVGLIWLNK